MVLTQAHPFPSICGRRKRTHNHSGRPALRRPLANVAKFLRRRNGAKSLILERANWDHIRVPVTCSCAGSSRPASALLAAETHIASRKVDCRASTFRRMTTPCHSGREKMSIRHASVHAEHIRIERAQRMAVATCQRAVRLTSPKCNYERTSKHCAVLGLTASPDP